MPNGNGFQKPSLNKTWLLKEMGIPDHLTCLLRNLYAGQEATVRTGHGTTDWFQIGKGVRQGCICEAVISYYLFVALKNRVLFHLLFKIAIS